jgi:hypothetical protein
MSIGAQPPSSSASDKASTIRANAPLVAPPSSAFKAKGEDSQALANEYREYARAAQVAYTQLPATWRFRLAEPTVVMSQAIALGAFCIWGWLLRSTWSSAFAFISPAYAATDGQPLDQKLYINLAIFVSLGVGYVVSLWVNYFSKSEKAAESAGGYSRTLLGFFIGAATKYLGM